MIINEKSPINQEKFQLSSILSKYSLSQDVYNICLTPTGKLSRKKLSIIDTLFKFFLRYTSVTLGHKYIKKEIGVGLTTITEVMTALEKIGLFKQERRYYRNKEIASRYYLNPIYRDNSVLKSLAEFLPSLRRMPALFFNTISVFLLLSGNPLTAVADQLYKDFDNRELNRFIKRDFKYRKRYNGESKFLSNAIPIGNCLQKMMNGEKNPEVKPVRYQQRERQNDLATQILIQHVKDEKTNRGLDILEELLRGGLL